MDFGAIWELVKTLGPGGATLCLLLWLDERRERRQGQRQREKLHRENTKRLEHLLRMVAKIAPATDARVSSIAKSGRTRRRGGG